MASRKILVVDDDAPLRQAVRQLLECNGYTVIEAANGAEALTLAANLQPHLILLDLALPDGDGAEFAQELRRRASTTHIPIVVFTGEVVHGQRAEILSTICAGIIPKPVSPERLQRDLGLLVMLGRRSVSRRFPRYPVEISAGCRLLDSSHPAADLLEGVVRVLGEGGLRIDLPEPIAEASTLELYLPQRTGQVTAAGRIVYASPSLDNRTGATAFQHGVQFVEMPPDTSAALKRLMRDIGIATG